MSLPRESLRWDDVWWSSNVPNLGVERKNAEHNCTCHAYVICKMATPLKMFDCSHGLQSAGLKLQYFVSGYFFIAHLKCW